MHKNKHHHLVLSIYPAVRGFAFVLFDSPKKIIDWGKREIGKDVIGAKAVDAITELLRRNRPDIVVIDDVEERRSVPAMRLKRIYRALQRPIADVGAEIAVVSRRNVRLAFAQFGALTKQDIANVIAERIEALSTRVPRPRKPWTGEDYRMGVFDAASRALAYYHMEDQVNSASHGKDA
ncbi:MAG: hypothetical protein JWQ07_129 [Ramlibacter sp.]|nr:hypothetical protein [Ramlibacter sp.]